ncbi:MAG: hypothetical protein H5U40_19245 [Polyangiaceae bacterium]|nr:hypothetical protein [Polyangiaceae bacterium]
MFVAAAGALGDIPGVPRGPATEGAFRSPAAVPAGRIVVSCDLDADDLKAGPFAWSLCELDSTTGAVRLLGGEVGLSNVEAVAVVSRVFQGVFTSRPDEVNAHTLVIPDQDRAEVHVHDFPLLATLLFANIRTQRPIDHAIGGLNVYEAMPPPGSAITFGDVAADTVSDQFGQVFVDHRRLGWVPLRGDGSARFSVPGGAPILLEVTDHRGDVFAFSQGDLFSGPMRQREQMQFYPGERSNQSLQRRFFNGLCGGCHGSITGRELDIAVDIDVLTGASRTSSYDDAPVDLTR